VGAIKNTNAEQIVALNIRIKIMSVMPERGWIVNTGQVTGPFLSQTVYKDGLTSAKPLRKLI
jgi:hypothetical protein